MKPRKVDVGTVHEMLKRGLTRTEIANKLGATEFTVWKAMKKDPLSELKKRPKKRGKKPKIDRSKNVVKLKLEPQQERIIKIMKNGEWFSHRWLYNKLNSDMYYSVQSQKSIQKIMQGLINRRLVERRKLIIKARIGLEAKINQYESSKWAWVYRLKIS